MNYGPVPVNSAQAFFDTEEADVIILNDQPKLLQCSP